MGDLNIRIGSVRHDTGVYIGRAGRGKAASPLANPFTVKQYGREGAIERYRTWLWGCIQHGNQEVMAELNRLRQLAQAKEGVTLVCFCRSVDEEAPACHGDVIAAAIRWLDEQIQADPCTQMAVDELGAMVVRFN